MTYMLDTNICIYVLKKKPEKVFQKLMTINPNDVCISAVTYAELIHGVEKSAMVERNRVALAMMLANIRVLDFDVNAANEYGKIRATLEKRGTPIGPLDTMIAGHAISCDCIVITNNEKEFSRVPGLKVENWI